MKAMRAAAMLRRLSSLAISVVAAAVAVLFMFGVSAALPEWAPLFRAAQTYSAGDWKTSSLYRTGAPAGVAVADFNGDGRPDLVVTNPFDSLNSAGTTVSVLLHSNDPSSRGLFQPKVNYQAGTGPGYVLAADMNRDGHLDIVTSNGGDSLAILLGTGLGTFASPILYFAHVENANLPFFGFAIADVNNDGWPDVVVPSETFWVSVLLGNGDGTLGSPIRYAVDNPQIGTEGTCRVAVGDVTGDGAPDIVVAGQQPGLVILVGNNTGTFTIGPTLPVTSAGDVAIADLNGDGIPDILALADGLTVLLGLGGGSFPSAVTYAFPAASFMMCDPDGDGKIDVVGTTPDYGEVSWMSSISVRRGNGNGTFGALSTFPAPPGTGPARLADLDLDGKLDWVAATRGNGEERTHAANVLLGDGTGAFRTPPTSATRTAVQFAVADYNRDGRLDAAYAPSASGATDSIRVAIGNGDGTFTDIYSLVGSGAGIGSIVATADWNRDGIPDLAYQTTGNQILHVLGFGNGTFFVPGGGMAPVLNGALLFPRSFVDMNRDGWPDLLVGDPVSPSELRIQRRVPGSGYAFAQGMAATSPIQSLVTGDWNLDGVPDIVLAKANGLSILTGTGSGTVNAEIDIASGRSYADACVGDFNHDGKPDLAALEGTAGQSGTRGIDVYLGNGLGGFVLAASLPTFEQNGLSIETWDADQDGNLDLVASGIDDRAPLLNEERLVTAEVHLGNGLGGFGPELDYSLGAVGGPYGPPSAVADMNRDGAPDIVAPYQNSSIQTLLALPPTFSPLLGPRMDYPTGSSTGHLAVGDLNRDGIPDVVASSIAGPISVRLGLGKGRLGPSTTVSQSLAAVQVALADVNRDGILDLLFARTLLGDPEIVSCMLGNGDGTFGPRLDNATVSVLDFAVADMNRDGKPDLVVGRPYDSGGSFVQVLLGNGDGTFTAAAATSVPMVYDVEVFDYNRDGILDVGVAGGGVYVLQGVGDGTLGAAITLDLGTSTAQAICTADFNRDGIADIAVSDLSATVRVYNSTTFVTSSTPESGWDLQVGTAQSDGRQFLYLSTQNTNSVVILRPASTPDSFTPVATYPTGGDPQTLAVADMDGDGLLDVLTANSADGTLSVFLHAKSSVTAVSTQPEPAPRARLEQNYPNPFNPRTTIRYSVAKAGPVRLAVYDVRGRLVATLVDGSVAVGEHRVSWDGRTTVGTTAASGVYFYRLETMSGIEPPRRMVMLK